MRFGRATRRTYCLGNGLPSLTVRRVETSLAGVVAVVLLVLVLGYLVPQKVRQRQELLQAHTEERWSSRLRVLPIQAAAPTEARVATGSEPVRLLGAAPESPGGSGPSRGENLMKPVPSASDASVAARRVQLEVRAKRTRRRLWLTLFLMLATATVWALVPTTRLLWYAGVAPSVLLVCVLVLGRLAARKGAKADAAWARTAAARAASRRPMAPEAAPSVVGNASPSSPPGDQVPRDASLAARPSQQKIQGKPPVAVKQAAAQGSRGATRAAAVTESIPRSALEELELLPALDSPAPEPLAADARQGTGVVPAEESSEVPAGAVTWEPRDLPVPRYLLPQPVLAPDPSLFAPTTSWSLGKDEPNSVTHQAPEPLTTGETSEGASGAVVTDQVVEGDSEDMATIVDLAEDHPRPTTESLGLPLAQILARRRAAS